MITCNTIFQAKIENNRDSALNIMLIRISAFNAVASLIKQIKISNMQNKIKK